MSKITNDGFCSDCMAQDALGL